MQDIQRLEAGHHDRHAILGGDGDIFLVAHHRADVAGGQKALHAAVGRAQNRLHGRRHQHVRDQQREVLEALLRGLINRHRRGGGGGFEADAEEDHFLGRVLLRELHGVQRRIDDPHIAAAGFDGQQIGRAARHAEHVAERAEDHVRPGGDLQRLVNQFERRDADRAAGAVDERDLLGQQFIDAELDDGMGLAAADLHEGPGPGGDAGDLARELLRGFAIAVFVEVFHRASGAEGEGEGPGEAGAAAALLSSNSLSSCIWRRYSNTLLASASSTRLSAKPTWTMT